MSPLFGRNVNWITGTAVAGERMATRAESSWPHTVPYLRVREFMIVGARYYPRSTSGHAHALFRQVDSAPIRTHRSTGPVRTERRSTAGRTLAPIHVLGPRLQAAVDGAVVCDAQREDQELGVLMA